MPGLGMRRFGRALLWLAGAALATPAAAEWREATSPHFVLYANLSEADLAAMATRLEQFDAALRRLFAARAEEAPGANKLTIYVTPSISAVQKLCRCDGVAGFYQPRASGPVAFTVRAGETGAGVDPQVVLLHEYTHHFLLGSFAAPYPAWFSEGFAEFTATARFEEDGVVVGDGAQHRAGSLFYGERLSAEEMFAAGRQRMTMAQVGSLYARGWLLTHYLILDAARMKQLGAYLTALRAGTPSPQAARDAFGDLKALDRALDKYLGARRIAAVRLPLAPSPPVTVRQLTPGQRALIDLRMESTRGVNGKTAEPLFQRARKVAAAHPDDPVAQGWLAEMAFDAGDDAAAEAAADRALAVDPRQIQALLYKARVALRRAVAAKSTDPAVWKAARAFIIRANRVDNDDAETLLLYYASFRDQGIAPTTSAVDGLWRAQALVPQDPGVRVTAARQALVDGNLAAARAVLVPIAFDPHQATDNLSARLVAAIDAKMPAPELLALLDAPAG